MTRKEPISSFVSVEGILYNERVRSLPVPLIDYDMLITIEKIGNFPIPIWSIRDMDRALDEICKKYPPSSPEEETRLLDLCPYFATLWPSARALGLLMSEQKSLFSKKRGIEVGCGLGLNSILGAKLGAQMTAADFHPDAGLWLEKNSELNSVRIAYREWDWTTPPPSDLLSEGRFDFVLASDVLYESRHPSDLVHALIRLIGEKGSIFLADPGRSYLPRALEEFEKNGFTRVEFEFDVEESSSLPEHRLEKKRKVKVFQLLRD
jgi:predicted nicotinamide N-methyase